MTLALDRTVAVRTPRRPAALRPVAVRATAAVHQAGRVVGLGVALVLADLLTAPLGGHVDQSPTRRGGTA